MSDAQPTNDPELSRILQGAIETLARSAEAGRLQ
jgi:hypothetical protein